MNSAAKGRSRLVAIKLLHTIVWAALVSCIVSIPMFALSGRFGWALAASGIVFAECAVLAFNRGKCPLTDIAARHTEDREANFDIYIPAWLAKYNKTIFGLLFVVNEAALLGLWLARRG